MKLQRLMGFARRAIDDYKMIDEVWDQKEINFKS